MRFRIKLSFLADSSDKPDPKPQTKRVETSDTDLKKIIEELDKEEKKARDAKREQEGE
jgi:hypothetical protein